MYRFLYLFVVLFLVASCKEKQRNAGVHSQSSIEKYSRFDEELYPTIVFDLIHSAELIELRRNLILNGANPNLLGPEGYTLLHLYLMSDHYEEAEWLLANQSDINLEAVNGTRPLGIVLERIGRGSSIERVEYLLDHGANPNLPLNANGDFSVDLVVQNYPVDFEEELLVLLKERGAHTTSQSLRHFIKFDEKRFMESLYRPPFHEGVGVEDHLRVAFLRSFPEHGLKILPRDSSLCDRDCEVVFSPDSVRIKSDFFSLSESGTLSSRLKFDLDLDGLSDFGSEEDFYFFYNLREPNFSFENYVFSAPEWNWRTQSINVPSDCSARDRFGALRFIARKFRNTVGTVFGYRSTGTDHNPNCYLHGVARRMDDGTQDYLSNLNDSDFSKDELNLYFQKVVELKNSFFALYGIPGQGFKVGFISKENFSLMREFDQFSLFYRNKRDVKISVFEDGNKVALIFRYQNQDRVVIFDALEHEVLEEYSFPIVQTVQVEDGSEVQLVSFQYGYQVFKEFVGGVTNDGIFHRLARTTEDNIFYEAYRDGILIARSIYERRVPVCIHRSHFDNSLLQWGLLNLFCKQDNGEFYLRSYDLEKLRYSGRAI